MKPTLRKYSDGCWVCSFRKYEGAHGFSRESGMVAYYKLLAFMETAKRYNIYND